MNEEHANEDDSVGGGLRDRDGRCLGRSVRRRQVGARDARRIPPLDDPVRDRLAALAPGPRRRGGPRRAPLRRAWAALVRARVARVRRIQPARLHRPRPRATSERLADRRARPAPDRARALAPHPRAPIRYDLRPARSGPGRGQPRDQRRPPDDDRERLDRLGGRARARGRLQLRPLRARRRRAAGLLAAPLHGADVGARVVDARRRDGSRDRGGAGCAPVRPRGLVGDRRSRT